jgi:hypothetical protein
MERNCGARLIVKISLQVRAHDIELDVRAFSAPGRHRRRSGPGVTRLTHEEVLGGTTPERKINLLMEVIDAANTPRGDPRDATAGAECRSMAMTHGSGVRP